MGLGLELAGYFSRWVVAPLAAVVVVTSIRPSHLAVVMAGIGAQHGMFILVMRDQADLWWVSVLFVVVFLVAGWKRRFWDVLWPAFRERSGTLAPGRRRHRGRVVDDKAE